MWTEEQARSLIPDAGTLKRGLELASPSKWQNLGQTTEAAWGECAGSGSKPYLVGIDLGGGPAFKCSCPSRVFPCKHGAGLLILLARQPQLLSGTEPPAWLAEWLGKRQQTQEKKAVKAEEAAAKAADAPEEAAAPDAPAGAAVAPARRQRMARGAAELLTWLHDVMGTGLAQAEQQGAAFWEQQAARLVDDQVPGLAATLRELPGLRYAGADWPERQLSRLGELYLLARALLRLDELPEALRQDVLQLAGVNVKKEELLARQPAVTDTWLVAGQVSIEEERLLVRRSWLWGETAGRYALVLEFSFGGQPFATPLVFGARYRGGVVFYPGALGLRAAVGPDWTFRGLQTEQLPPATAPAELLDAYAAALGRLPWLREWPGTLAGMVPVLLPDGQVALRHAPTGQQLALHPDSPAGWDLLAASGGYPITLFGEWNGRTFLPITYTSAAAPVAAPTAP
ncbi:SWIM zinc finger family protein [Hymenobacter gummosus]|uniref:SWIM zinc finger family protein n=1 Tax=Hymenobacter gummosus TaxID=1776032 RepID=A0A3S0IJF0_9BACT|nr:SWIM zinc finger family protein [Hymenobacter gummosus]RTQ45594.1 SWIM zinc finger family protein [Hymenobacter gummosus]